MLNLKNHCQNSALNFRGNQNIGRQTVKDNLRQKIMLSSTHTFGPIKTDNSTRLQYSCIYENLNIHNNEKYVPEVNMPFVDCLDLHNQFEVLQLQQP